MKLRIAIIAMIGITAMLLSFNTMQTITGKITDEKGRPVYGATVAVKGTSIAVVTDSSGNFTINIPDGKKILIISSVGYENQEINIQSHQGMLNVSLISAADKLEEVVVTGYATAKRKSITGSVMSVMPDMVVKDEYFLSPVLEDNKNEPDDSWRYNNNFNTEEYDHITENPFLKVNNNPLSTFSIDVDAASYSNIRRFIKNGSLPPAGAVRIEEMINYFPYHYKAPENDEPFSIYTEAGECPWNTKHNLILIGLQGKRIETENLPASNLVFLIDVSGSMEDYNKLPLVKQSLKLLIEQLREQDKISIVVYAGNAGVVLPATEGSEKEELESAIDRLEAGGSTAGGAGIKLAYKIAAENFIKNGNNRIILCTDGDFNVGVSSNDELETMIEKERASGIFLTVLGYGMGNYKDNKMEILADKGNGNHAYIDDISEAKKVLVNEFGGTLFTIAKDVKLQIEFNPALVQSYRLIGYENRMLAKEDFNNDKKDAGELGSGHTVTALYEIVPAGVPDETIDSVDALRYQKSTAKIEPASFGNELMNIKFRYKKPDGDKSSLIEQVLENKPSSLQKTSSNFRFAAAVAEFGMLLRNSKHKGNANLNSVLQLVLSTLNEDRDEYRREFRELVKKAKTISLKDDQAKAE